MTPNKRNFRPRVERQTKQLVFVPAAIRRVTGRAYEVAPISRMHAIDTHFRQTTLTENEEQ